MGRRSHLRALDVWMNGLLVGQWRLPAHGPMEFAYDTAWLAAPESRPLSLSLPMNFDGVPLRGERVGNFFDNLLPDSEPIRRRLQSRFKTQSRNAFDLLAAIGRDCVGAVQLLPSSATPGDVFLTQVEPLDDSEIEHWLQRAASGNNTVPLHEDEEDFRISIAGAQEKTAFTWHDGRWCRPLGSTPTTHIFKLPLGLVGARQADMHTSLENEWLCAALLRAYGLPTANCTIAQFGAQKTLIVERFDRRKAVGGTYWLRLPQEDFCQALGVPASAKYEADGGPGLREMAAILRASETPEADVATLLRAQLLFWLLAATDGHAKNFSLHLLAGGRYRLAPLYDVLSAWPVVGAGPNQLDYNKLRLAMAVRSRNAHYRLRDICPRHFLATARQCGFGDGMESIMEDVAQRTPTVIEQVSSMLPKGFPIHVFETITHGLEKSAARLADA